MKPLKSSNFHKVISSSNDQVTSAETAEILRLAEQCLSAAGDFVELGCYRGDTSVLLGKLLVENLCKTLWIYDSFAGLPEKTTEDSSGAGQNFQKGELLVTKREIVEKLRKHGLKITNHPDPTVSSIIIKKAWFDELQSTDLPDRIAFAFLDGDLYSSIKTSLQLVIPRLADQGIIIVHDYNNPELPGSARAVDEFLRSHPEYHLTQKHTLAIIAHKC